MLNKLDAELSFHQNALRLRGQRQELIAGNIANADTPHFKARDIDFKTALQNANAGLAGETVTASKTSAMHLDAGSVNQDSSAKVLFRNIAQANIDGNTVDMDVERNQFVDNSIRYEASLTMINAQLKKMLAAIQGS